jgi:hypothetical protein
MKSHFHASLAKGNVIHEEIPHLRACPKGPQSSLHVIPVEAGIQRRRPVIGRGLNENETSTLA